MSVRATEVEWSAATRKFGLAEIFAKIHAGAAERDRHGVLLQQQVAELKKARFSALRVPEGLGGQGASLVEFYAVIEDLGFADPNVAHIFRNHFSLTETFVRSPDGSLAKRQLAKVVAGDFFSFSFTEQESKSAGVQGESLVLEKSGPGYILNGQRIYSTGNAYVDWIWVYTADRDGNVRYAVLPRSRSGLDTTNDWDGFGQRLTVSGKTIFKSVQVEPDEVTAVGDGSFSNEPTYKATFTQLYMTTIVSGITRNVLHDVKTEVFRRRNFHHGLAPAAKDDPIIQATVGWISAHVYAVRAAAAEAARTLEAAWAARAPGEERERAILRASLNAARTKIFVDREAPEIATRFFEAGGASTTSASLNYDRHWRNIRTIGQHNPASFKERLIGDHELNGAVPPGTVTFF